MDTITLHFVFLKLHRNREKDFLRSNYFFTIWPCLPQPRARMPAPRGHKFHNSDRRLHGHHDNFFHFFPLKCVGVEKKMVRVVQPWLLQFRFLTIRILHTNNDNNWPCCSQEEVKNVRLLTNDDGHIAKGHLSLLTPKIVDL